MSLRLTNDVDIGQTKKMFEILYQHSQVFKGCSQSEVEDLITVLKILSFDKGNNIVKFGEQVDMMAIVLYGEIRVGMENLLKPADIKKGKKIHYLSVGDMFGHQNLSE